MKTSTNFSGVVMIAIVLSGTSDLQAQGKGHDNGNRNPGHIKESNAGKSHNTDFSNGNNREFYSDASRGRRNDHDYDRRKGHGRNYDDRYYRYDHRDRYVTYRYRHQSHSSWAPDYGYRYNTRYIYYQDYNVYYDCHRDVFVTWTGRNWATSTRIPDVMYRIDFRSARVAGVDYWDDDFDYYLTRRRPSYISISAGW